MVLKEDRLSMSSHPATQWYGHWYLAICCYNSTNLFQCHPLSFRTDRPRPLSLQVDGPPSGSMDLNHSPSGSMDPTHSPLYFSHLPCVHSNHTFAFTHNWPPSHSLLFLPTVTSPSLTHLTIVTSPPAVSPTSSKRCKARGRGRGQEIAPTLADNASYTLSLPFSQAPGWKVRVMLFWIGVDPGSTAPVDTSMSASELFSHYFTY